jgi:hypothetical protein
VGLSVLLAKNKTPEQICSRIAKNVFAVELITAPYRKTQMAVLSRGTHIKENIDGFFQHSRQSQPKDNKSQFRTIAAFNVKSKTKRTHSPQR